MDAERWSRLHPLEERRVPYVEQLLGDRPGPVVAASDYIRAFPDQIRPYVKQPFHVLGTDGFGRSDYRRTLRSFFEVDRHHVAVAALSALAETGDIEPQRVAEAIERYEIDAEVEAPWRR
jgi:pyruvate dehydrogenase E1 component